MTVSMVEVRVTGLKELNQKRKRLDEKKPGLRICGELAKQMVQNMKSLAPYWSGTLMKSIQSRQTKEGYNIHMVEYGRYIDRGVAPNRLYLPAYAPRFQLWTAAHGFNWSTMRRTVAMEGISAQPFIQPSVEGAMAVFDTTAVTVMNKTIKEAGFR
jgi:hypothetical protein